MTDSRVYRSSKKGRIYKMNNELSALPLKDIDPNRLSDINSVDVNADLPIPERIRDYVIQMKSPYMFRVNGKAVKVVFNNSSSISLEEGVTKALTNIISSNS